MIDSTGPYWQLACRQVRSHARMTGKSPLAMELMDSVAQRFCDLPVPTSQAELDARQRLLVTVCSIIRDLGHAEIMAQKVPSATDEIVDQMKQYANLDLQSHGRTASIQFINTIGEISQRHQMERVAGRS